MPVTFKIARHNAEPLSNSEALSTKQLLERVWQPSDTSCKEMLQSSFYPKPEFNATVRNGFIDTVLWAYNKHHNLIIRPENIWLAILGQLNLYINVHAEELRSKFVAPEGKMPLEIWDLGSRHTVDFGRLAEIFKLSLKNRGVNPALHEWASPSYSTTTPEDIIICSIMTMGTFKSYSSYEVVAECGLPSVTLLGEKHDYEAILQKIDKLEEFGEEPTVFARYLRPILVQFIVAFDVVAQGGTPNSKFWERICRIHPRGSETTYLSGWLSAFCSWDRDGTWQGPKLHLIMEPLPAKESKLEYDHDDWDSLPAPMIYEGLRYPVINTNNIPPGFCEVDVKVDDNGQELDCMMVAGHVGSISSGKGALDTLQPSPEWFMFIKGDAPKNLHH